MAEARAAGCTIEEAKEAGYVEGIQEAGYTIDECFAAVFSCQQVPTYYLLLTTYYLLLTTYLLFSCQQVRMAGFVAGLLTHLLTHLLTYSLTYLLTTTTN